MTRQSVPSWSRLRRLFQDIGTMLVFGAVVMVIAVWFPRPAAQAPRPGREGESEDRPGSGMTVHSQVLHIWLPEPLADMAQGKFPPGVAQSHHELRQALERKGHQDLWYAYAVRLLQDNGATTEILFIRHPYSEPERFQDFLDILATAAGKPPRYLAADYVGAKLQVLPGTISSRQFLETIAPSRVNP